MNMNNQLKTDLIKALLALKDNAQLSIDTTEDWQNEYIIGMYRDNIKLAEKLLKDIRKSKNF